MLRRTTPRPCCALPLVIYHLLLIRDGVRGRQDMDDDALSYGKIWSVNYFFYNKQLKKLAFFACWIKSKIRSRDEDEGEDMDRWCARDGEE